MSEWIDTTLGDDRYFKIKGSGINYFDGGKDYLSTSSVEETKIAYVEQEITFTKRPSRANMQPVENSIWFAKMKNTLKVLKSDAYLVNKAILSTGFCGIECLSFNDEYLKQFVLSKRFNDQKNLLAEGSTQEAVNNSKIKTIKIGFPKDITEQDDIATILSTLDRAINATEQLIFKYQRIKTGLLHDLLTHGIDEHGNLRSEKTHKFKDSKLGRIPVEWQVISLKQLMIKGRGFIQTGPFGSQLHSYEYVSEGIPVIMPQDIQELTISTENIARITEQKANSLSKHLVIDGDIIYARRGDISRCAVITTNQKGWFCGTGCILMRFEKEDILNPNWFKLFYQSSKGQNQIKANAVGLMMINLNSSVLNQLNIYLVPIDEQNSIVRISKNIESSIQNFRINLTKLQSIKSGLMQDLLSGRVRVKI